MKTLPNVSIIIVNWNGANDTIECIDSLTASINKNFNVVIIDNFSSDNSLDEIKKYCKIKKININLVDSKTLAPVSMEIDNVLGKNDACNKNLNVDLIENKNNDGYAKGNNLGIRFAIKQYNSEYYLILNNDTIVSSDLLINLINAMENDLSYGIVCPLILDYKDRNMIQYSSDSVNWYTGKISRKKMDLKGKIISSDTINGAAMFIRKETIKRIGLIPVDYFMLWEDIDYSIKAWRNGIKCGYVTNAHLWHKGSMSIGTFSNPIRVRYSLRNRLIFWRKYSKTHQYLIFLIFYFLYHALFIFIIGFTSTKNKNAFIKNYFLGICEGLLIL